MRSKANRNRVAVLVQGSYLAPVSARIPILRFDGVSSVPTTQPLESPPESEAVAKLTLWENLSFSVVHGLAAGLLKILSVRGMYAFGRFFGTFEWLFNFRRRRRFAVALETVLGRRPSASERRRETLEFFRQSRCDRLFYLIFDCIPNEQARGLLIITNRPLLDAAVAQGRGVYVAMAHYGSIHVMGMLLSLNGYKVAGVRDRKEGALRRYIQRKFDEKHPEFRRARVLFSDSFPRDIYRCLQDGYMLGSAIDINRIRDPQQKVDERTLFGQPRYFLTGPLRIALRCRSPILQGSIIPEPGFRYRFEIRGLIPNPETVQDEPLAIAAAMDQYVSNLEDHVRARPSLMTRI